MQAAQQLRPGSELEIDFTDVLANGQGVGRAEGIVVFCFGPLAQERARVRIVEIKQRYAVGEMRELLRVSPQRVEPFCPVFGACGGCQLQHMAYDAQLAWKREVVRNALARIGGLEDVRVNEAIGMPNPRAYRNKMALVVHRRTEPPALGFYRQRSHDVVAIDRCPIVAPELDALLRRLVATRSSPPVARALREARHLVARGSRATQRALMAITTPQRIAGGPQLGSELLRELPELTGVANSYGLGSANAILGRRTETLAGEGEIEERSGELRYRFGAASFFQVNVEMLARIFGYMEPWLELPGTIVDAYCGSGTFALCFAHMGWRVLGIEENPRAIEEARANARRNHLAERARFTTGRVEQMAASPDVRAALREAAVVFLDPPRKGCEPAALDAIAAARAPRVWYLSCDAATLARDLKFLTAKGYRLESVQPFDMFPQTGHVETLVNLELGST